MKKKKKIEDKKKITFMGALSEESHKKLIEILDALDPVNHTHAVDILAYSLVVGTSINLLEAIGRFETFKNRVYALEDQPEVLEQWEKARQKDRPKKQLESGFGG